MWPSTTLSALGEDAVILCATHRLARNLRLATDRNKIAEGATSWRPLAAMTPVQWLDGVTQEAILAGDIAVDSAPRLVLSPLQERILWDRAIEVGADDAPENLLFDRDGLADAAAEANALMITWGIRPREGEHGEETQRFLRWRREFRRTCEQAGWFEAARLFEWHIARLAAGAGRLPAQTAFAGFDRYNPLERRLAEVLSERGVAVSELEVGLAAEANAVSLELADREAECRAAAAWTQRRLQENPACRLGIVVPELGTLRRTLANILDDALHPGVVAAASAGMARRYNFSLGSPLASQAVVDVALRLLGLAAYPRRLAQEDCGELLRRPYWSADVAEADGRARLDAQMRQLLPPTLSLDRWLRFTRKAAERGLALPRLGADIEALKATLAAQPARQLPSAWAAACRSMLAAARWPGQRSLSSHEFQARGAFFESLDALAQLDAVLGRVPLREAHRRLSQLCRDSIFQAETQGDPPVQVMGPLEAAGMPLDGLWVMGMNDHLWPPSARPNPLLPAELQRRAGSPGASAEEQGNFAAAIQRRLLRSAPEVVFSRAHGEADRELRPSPLLAGIAAGDAAAFPPSQALLETFVGSGRLEIRDDAQAPPVAAGEKVRGGTWLLRAQAICPAWAFYQYRLGASALQSATEGLDAAERGTLLHLALQRFWQGRGSRDLQAMTVAVREAAIAAAVAQALTEFTAAADEALPPRLLELEYERLVSLLGVWLSVEAGRSLPFSVIAGEREVETDIEGIAVKLVVDRVDQLEDGRCVIIDYKTGSVVSHASWAAARITEPQLPIYAQLTGETVAAVAFARVRLDEPGFVGIAVADGILPDVGGLDSKAGRRIFAADEFPDWPSMLALWQERIAAIAREVKAGEAAVRFAKEADLAYCDVRPLLRLAERRTQLEGGEAP
jgi:probable DNA repair protein